MGSVPPGKPQLGCLTTNRNKWISESRWRAHQLFLKLPWKRATACTAISLPGRGSVRVLGPKSKAVQKWRHPQIFHQIQSGRRDRRDGNARDGNTLNHVPPRGKPSQLEQLPRTRQLPASFSYTHYREGGSSTHLPAYKSTHSFVHLFTHSLRKDYVSGFCFVLAVEKTKFLF